MSSARISNSQECDQHSYCPHLHFKKCRRERYTRIPYTTRAIKEIDLTCNVHPKVLGQLTTRNIPTLALQNYIADPVLPDQEDTNFTKNYYLQNCPEKFQLRNTLLRDTEEQLAQHNAYSLAAGATEEYNQFAKKREEYLQNARRRAGTAYNQFMFEQKQSRDNLKAEQVKWITNYFRKVEELIDHIFSRENTQNEDPNLKDKQFIKEHQGKDAKALGKVKIKDPQSALDILGALRALLLRKKVQLQEQRLDQQHDKSVSASYMDASSASNTSQQNLSGVSMISATTNATKADNEAHFAERFCEFQKLKKKWGKDTVQEVRNTLRVMLARDLINKAEGSQMRQKKKARERDNFLKKEMQKMGKLKGQSDKNLKGSKGAKQLKKDVKQQQQKPVIFFNEPLSKDQQIVKSTLLKGGIFDSVGNIYERNRNYSKLFRKRGQQSLCELSFRESPPRKQLLTTRAPFH